MKLFSEVATRKTYYGFDTIDEAYFITKAMRMAVGPLTTTSEVQESIFTIKPTDALYPARIAEVLRDKLFDFYVRDETADNGELLQLPAAATHVAMTALKWLTPDADMPSNWSVLDHDRQIAGEIYADYKELTIASALVIT